MNGSTVNNSLLGLQPHIQAEKLNNNSQLSAEK